MASLAVCIDDPDRFSELDIALHEAVCAAAHNFLLAQFMNIVSTLGKVSRERTGGLRTVREAALRDHRRILDALRAHDPDAAQRAMLEHLDHVEQGLRPAAGTDDVELTTEDPDAAWIGAEPGTNGPPTAPGGAETAANASDPELTTAGTRAR